MSKSVFPLAPFAILSLLLLVFSCSSKEENGSQADDPAIVGTWVKTNFDGNWFTLTIESSDTGYRIDFPGDLLDDISGRYSISEGNITFQDVEGSRSCPDMAGNYRYSVKENLLCFSLVEDSCSGRAQIIHGDWMVPNYLDIIKEYGSIISSDSTNGDAYYSRGLLRLAARNYKDAFQDLDRAVELGVEHAEAFAKRGLARVMSSRDYRGGLADLDRAIELDPEMGSAYYDRGRIKMELDDKLGACQDWERAFELGYARAEKLMLHHCRYILKDRYLKGRYPQRKSGKGEKPQ